LIGIATASFLSLLLWFIVTIYLGSTFKWIGIGMGAFIGWAGFWLAKEKSVRLGVAASVATALVLLLGLVWAASHEAALATRISLDYMWDEQKAYADEAVKARTDDQLRAFLAKEGADVAFSESVGDLESLIAAAVKDSGNAEITSKDLADFRRAKLPKLRDIAEGKFSRGSFEREHRPAIEKLFGSAFLFAEIVRVRVLFLLCFAIGAAWKLSGAAD